MQARRMTRLSVRRRVSPSGIWSTMALGLDSSSGMSGSTSLVSSLAGTGAERTISPSVSAAIAIGVLPSVAQRTRARKRTLGPSIG